MNKKSHANETTLNKNSTIDREPLAVLAQTVYDELGCGVPNELHSILLKKELYYLKS